MKNVDVHTLAAALARGEPCFDTRSRARFEQGSLKGANHLSLEQIQAGALPALPPDTPIYLLCERGVISELAGLYLEASGFSQVYNVEGGLVAWQAAFGPLGESPPGNAD